MTKIEKLSPVKVKKLCYIYNLSLFLEDMFFLDVDRLQMWVPDGKREWITQDELRRLVIICNDGSDSGCSKKMYLCA